MDGRLTTLHLAECIILFRKSVIAAASLDSVTTVWGKNIGISSILDLSIECLVSLSVNVGREFLILNIII